jgi:hypothetical protein
LSRLQEFALIKDLKRHISDVHKDYKPFACRKCPAKFYQSGHLNSEAFVRCKTLLRSRSG